MHRVREIAVVALLLASSLFSTVPLAGAQNLGPDLSVGAIELEQEASPPPGEEANFTAVIQNDGGGDADSIDVVFRVDGQFLSRVENVSIPQDQQVTVTSDPWTVEAGAHVINVTTSDPAGDDCQIVGNCEAAGEQPFSFGADLVPLELTADPTEPIAGDEVVFTARIRNNGSSDVDDPFEVAFFVGGVQVGDAVEVAELAFAAETEIQSPAWDAEAGTHEISVELDPEDDVEEGNETNNDLGGVEIEVAPATPDLTLDFLVAQPVYPEDGQEVAFEAQVHNIGNGSADNSTVRFFVDGTTLTDADTPVPELAPGETYSATVREWTATTGRHTITAQADIDRNVSEASEANNEATLTVVVGSDLVAGNITMQPADAQTGDHVNFNATVTNEGQAIGTGFQVQFQVDGDIVGNVTISSLDAGESVNVASDAWNASAGSRTVTVVADVGETISEADEGNNEAEETVEIGEAEPDLTVTEATLSPQRPASDEDARFVATVKNRGNEDAGSFHVRFLVDGERVGEDKQVTGLGPGATTEVTSDAWTAERGNHTLTVIADAEQQLTGEAIEESDEENNELELNFGVGPDLAATDISWPTEVTADSDVVFETTVTNEGSEQAAAFVVELRLDGESLGEVTVETLEPGDTATVEHNATVTEGSHTVLALVDTNGTVEETDEENNEREESFSIGEAQPDLVVENLAAPSNARAGDSVAFLATITNAGDAGVASFKVSFQVDGNALGTRTIDALGAGDTASISSPPWAATQGSHTLTVTADADDQAAESDEANNDASETFQVDAAEEEDDSGLPGEPDLTVTSITWAEDPANGDRLTFLATVKNVGNAAAGSFAVAFELGDATDLGSRSLEKLEPGASATVTSTSWTAVEGTHEVAAEADVDGAVDEADETNNTLSATVDVQPADQDDGPGEAGADLTVTALSAGDETLEEDDEVAFTAEIHNQGESDAAGFVVAFFVDDKLLGENKTIDALASGASVNVTSDPWEATDGEHTVRVHVDALEELSEADEANNVETTTVSVEGSSGIPGPGALFAMTLLAAAALARRHRRQR